MRTHDNRMHRFKIRSIIAPTKRTRSAPLYIRQNATSRLSRDLLRTTRKTSHQHSRVKPNVEYNCACMRYLKQYSSSVSRAFETKKNKDESQAKPSQAKPSQLTHGIITRRTPREYARGNEGPPFTLASEDISFQYSGSNRKRPALIFRYSRC